MTQPRRPRFTLAVEDFAVLSLKMGHCVCVCVLLHKLFFFFYSSFIGIFYIYIYTHAQPNYAMIIYFNITLAGA